MRRAWRGPVTCLAAAVCAVAPASAQYTYFTPVPDSALTILAGETAQIDLTGYIPGGVSAYDITIFLDGQRVQLVAADTVPGYGLPQPTLVTGTDQVTVSMTGGASTSSYPGLARLTFALDAGATAGTFVTVRVNALTLGDGTTDYTAQMRSQELRICQAERLWGDVDGNRAVTSRDALVVITAAVGLPVSGFDLSVGDVDDDGTATTRDALFILSEGVGIETYTRTTEAKPNRCDPLAPMPADVVYYVSGLPYLVAAGDTLPVALPALGVASYAPAWSPDGTRILLTQFVSGWYYDFVSIARDGSDADTMRVSATASDYTPAWSPDGTRLAFASDRVSPLSLFVANADGGNPLQVTDSIYVDVSSLIDWSPDGAQLAFTGYRWGNCCANALWVVNADGTGLREVFTGSSSQSPTYPVWAPTGDSLAYDASAVSRLFVVAAVGDSAGAPVSQLNGTQNYAGWLPEGQLFQGHVNSWNGYYYQLLQRRASDGRLLRLTNVTGVPTRPVWRRTGRYVDVVTVSPASLDFATGGPTQQQLTATVLDDLGGAIVPGSGIQWSTSDPAVATVDATGLVTSVGVGTATITASAGGWRLATATVTVNP